jgi:hypothetical protein
MRFVSRPQVGRVACGSARLASWKGLGKKIGTFPLTTGTSNDVPENRDFLDLVLDHRGREWELPQKRTEEGVDDSTRFIGRNGSEL